MGRKSREETNDGEAALNLQETVRLLPPPPTPAPHSEPEARVLCRLEVTSSVLRTTQLSTEGRNRDSDEERVPLDIVMPPLCSESPNVTCLQ